jgi:hypothetical protein
VQIADINKGKHIQTYQSAMSLIVINFTFLEGRDNEIVVKELGVADSHSNRASSYVCKRPYRWEEVPMFNARLNQAIDHGCKWNNGGVPYSEWKVCYIAKYHLLLQFIALGLRKPS